MTPNRSSTLAAASLVGVMFINMLGFGIVIPLLPFYGQSLNAAPWQIALIFSAFAMGGFFGEPIWGRLSDRVGRKPLLLFCCVAFIVLSYPGFLLILSLGAPWKVALVQVGFCLVIATFGGTGPAALVELFPTRSRTTLMSIGYSLAVAIFGGFAPFIATWLISATGTPLAPTFYLMGAGIVSAVTILSFRETAFERLR